jgi:hypothetical protein
LVELGEVAWNGGELSQGFIGKCDVLKTFLTLLDTDTTLKLVCLQHQYSTLSTSYLLVFLFLKTYHDKPQPLKKFKRETAELAPPTSLRMYEGVKTIYGCSSFCIN